ncbi:hypothetical protein Cni_G01392 [Canna indica]|uniref:glucan endo-1,3-beta-D-glucosidase n=2 Tax=Magnoliopsida TaxID=3398 RepID=A0AAQ3JN47_9LILI|nr:hypothetical protein Cni_G01392 [Canna indica]
MAAMATKLKSPWSRLLSLRPPPRIPSIHHLPPLSVTPPFPARPVPSAVHSVRRFSANPVMGDRVVQELLAEVEREKKLAQEARRKEGLALEDEEEDYLGVAPLIERLEKKQAKDLENIDQYWEPTDSESDDDERFSPDEVKKRLDEFEKKCKRHSELLKNFADAETLDEAHKWMTKIDKFEQRHLKLPLEYRVIGDLMNRLKESTGKERFILLQKLNRAVRLMDVKEAYDPDNPSNFGVIQNQQSGSPDDVVDSAGFEKEKAMIQGANLEEDDEDFTEAKEKDDVLIEKLNAIEKKLEEKLELLDHTFGKKGRVLEEEIRELVEERNTLTEKKRRPLYRKGFDVKVIDVNRTCKVTKGGQLVKYTALLATGNYHGVIGFAKAKGTTAKVAMQRAYEKCFQNLHYVDRYEDHTIAHAIQAKYEKTKLYLWPGPMRSGMSAAGRTVETVLYLAGFSNVKSKIIGSRNPLNVIKALFIALNAIETPKDVQEKFGRTVVEKYLLTEGVAAKMGWWSFGVLKVVPWLCLLECVCGIGANWGTQASHLLPPGTVVQMLKDNGIDKVKLFDAEDGALGALAKSGIQVMVGIPNDMLAGLAAEEKAAERWVSKNVSKYINDGVDIRYVAVGNEPFLQTYNGSYLQTTLPALQNIQAALIAAGLGNQVKATIPLNADVYGSSSSKPSDGDFRTNIHDIMLSIVKFLSDNGVPFTVNIYPFISLYDDPNFPVDYAFFEGSSSSIVDGSLTYSNVFDANHDTLVAALEKNGFMNVSIIVGEIGWPTDGDANANPQYAQKFNQGFMNHVLSGNGTPRRRGNIDAYLFSLIDEDEKSIQPGNFERHWGIFAYDGSPKYELHLGGTNSNSSLVGAKNIKYLDRKWCVLKPSVNLNDAEIAASVSYACGNADCTSLGYKTSCSTLDAQGNISYAFNSYYQKNDQDDRACGFKGLATITEKDPSNSTCKFNIMIDVESGTSRTIPMRMKLGIGLFLYVVVPFIVTLV